MASIGFGKSKEKSSTTGSNEVTPYEPTVGAIDNIITEAGNLFKDGQPDFLGGYDYSKLFADPTTGMLDLEKMGAGMADMFNPMGKDIESAYASAIAGNPTGITADYYNNLLNNNKSGSAFYDDLAQGGGTSYYDSMSTPANTYLDNFLSSTTDKISNQIGAEFAGMGRYGGGASYGNAVGSGVSAEVAPLMMAMAENERQREFDGLRDLDTNRFNAGSGYAELLSDTAGNLYNAQTSALLGSDDAFRNLADGTRGLIDASYAYAGLDNMRKDRMSEMDMMKSIYDAQSPYENLAMYSNFISPFAFGFPTTISSGTSSGKSSSMNFGLGG
jgi:hypothetical protein